MEGSAEMTAERDFIAFVLMATALSVSTLRICEQHKLKIISWILLQLVTLKGLEESAYRFAYGHHTWLR